MTSDFWKKQSSNLEIAQKNAEIPYAQEAKEHFGNIEKFAKDPEKAIKDLATEKIDKATTGFMEKASEGISKYTPEWLKKIGAFLEEHFSFLGGLKNWFGEKIGGISQWVMGWIWGILGIDLLKDKNKEKEKKSAEKETKTSTSPEQINDSESIQQAKELLKSKEIVTMVWTMTNFVKKTAGHLDEDLKNNSTTYANLKDFSVNALEIISSPIKLIAYFLEKGFKIAQIKEWSETLKKSWEQAFWIAVLGALGYKFVTGGKVVKGGIVGFILYGLDKEYTGGEVLKGTLQGVYGIPKEWKNKTGEWMQTLGLKNLGKALQEGEIFDFFREIKEAGIPAVLLGTGSATIAALQVWGRWIFIEPAKAWGEAFTEFFQSEFTEGLQTILAGQMPIMATAVGYKFLFKGQGWKSLAWAWEIALPRLALTHQGHLDLEMKLRELAEIPNLKSKFLYTPETAVKKAQYLAKKAAYYQIENPKKHGQALSELTDVIEIIKEGNHKKGWKIDKIEGTDKNYQFNLDKSKTNQIIAKELVDEAHSNWYKKTTLWEKTKNKFRKSYISEFKVGETIIYKDANGKMLQAEIFEIDSQNPEKMKLKDINGQTFEIEKKDLTEVKRIKPETFQGKSAEVKIEFEKEINKLGATLDEEHKKLIKVIAYWTPDEIEQAKVAFQNQKKQILAEVKKTYQKFGKDSLEALKNKPIAIGNFGKISLKGATYVYFWLEAWRIVKMFAQGESKNGTLAAVDLGLRLAPVSGTMMDAQDTWKYLKNWDFKQAGISGLFTVIGGVSDALWITGFGGAASRAGISGLKVAKMWIKGAKTASTLAEAEKVKDSAKTMQQSIKISAQETGKTIAETGQKIIKFIPAKQALAVSTPMLAAYLYQNLKPTEEEIK